MCSNRNSRGGCGHTCSSGDERLLVQLPYWAQLRFPAILSARSGIDKSLMSRVETLLTQGHGPLPTAKLIMTEHALEYSHRELLYLSANQMYGAAGSALTGSVVRFPDQFDPRGYGDRVPSADWLQRRFVDLMRGLEGHMDQQMQVRRTNRVSQDYSFKWSSKTAKLNGVAIFGGLSTMTNEYGEEDGGGGGPPPAKRPRGGN